MAGAGGSGETTIIALDGALELEGLDAFRARVARVGRVSGRRVVVDLRDVSFMDSVGLRALLAVRAEIEAGGGRLVVIAPRGSPAARVITLAGVRRELDVIESV